MDADKKKRLVTILTFLIPIIILTVIYMVFVKGSDGKSKNTLAYESTDADTMESSGYSSIVVPNAKDTSEIFDNQIQVLERKELEDLEKSESIEKQTRFHKEVVESSSKPESNMNVISSSKPQTRSEEKQIKSEGAKVNLVRTTNSPVIKKEVKEIKVDKVDQAETPIKKKGFYSTFDQKSNDKSTDNLEKKVVADLDFIPVIVDREEVLKSGQTLHLRTLSDFTINGVTIPKNTTITGAVQFSNERVFCQIGAIKLKDRIVPVNYAVHESDGVKGIYAPGTTNQEIGNNAASQGLSTGGTTVNVPLIGSVSTGALQKKLQDNTIRISKNYKLYLKPFTY